MTVCVDAKVPPSGEDGQSPRELEERFLAVLDRSVARRSRSVSAVRGGGPTPTPFFGPPLEPTPLGPPEPAPRTPIPGA